MAGRTLATRGAPVNSAASRQAGVSTPQTGNLWQKQTWPGSPVGPKQGTLQVLPALKLGCPTTAATD